MYCDSIEGAFTFKGFYNAIINKFDNGIFVEIGTYKGASIMFLAEKIKDLNKNIKLYGIDTFEGSIEHQEDPEVKAGKLYEVYLKNIDPLKDYIITIKGNSKEVYKQFEDESIDFLFIDADHAYESVKKDLELWFPKIKIGGIISGHDYLWIDGRVKRSVDEFFAPRIVNKGVGDVWYITKK